MPEQSPIPVGEFGASFKGFLDNVAAQAPAEEPYFGKRLQEHFGDSFATLPIVEEALDGSELPNLQMAVDRFMAGEARSAELLGIMSEQRLLGVSLSSLIAPAHGGLMGSSRSAVLGPVQYVNIPLEGEKVLACVQCGLYLIRDRDEPLAVLQTAMRELGLGQKLKVEVMAASGEIADGFLAEVRQSMREHSVYKGRVLSVTYERVEGGLQIAMVHPAAVEREQIILPSGLLDRVERQTLRFAKHCEALRSAGRHVKRGILLHGPPGTGKTMTAMYLITHMSKRTVLIPADRQAGALAGACRVARLLQPSTILLEDVDLVAQERTRQEVGCNSVLFELLNQMDRVSDDADVLFLLTTNRPDLLEPALASRPGRIDLAIELPLPDADCRDRLLKLYGAGLELHLSGTDRFVERTDGVSPAFIRELLRKAALIAADEGGVVQVEDRHVEEALGELLFHGSRLTRSLLGVRADLKPPS